MTLKVSWGQGTTFTIKLPIDRNAAEPVNPPADVALARSLRVLVVDDEALLRDLLESYLTTDGHIVQTAENAQAALARLSSGRYDVVITDKAMPEMNGEQLAEMISKRVPGVSVILMTGFGDIMKANGERPPHISAILSKPVTQATLRQALAQVFPPVTV